MALSFPFSANRHTSIIFCFLSLFAISFFEGVPVYGEKRAHYKPFHVVNVKSLHPNPNYCIESTKDQSKKESLQVVHKHGPCSHLNQDKAATATFAEILSNDQSRGSKATLPVKSGQSLGSGNYIVTLGLGTPKQDFTLTIDTGSDVTWIQCEQCISCYQQVEPIFNPSTSQTYKSLGCSTQCSQFHDATGFNPGCTSSTCRYKAGYADDSYSVGLLATETLTLTHSDIFPNFAFGCGSENNGTFNGAAGLLGLGRNPLSFFGQTGAKYGNYFSYCLPTFPSSGNLVFGKGGVTNPASLMYTPLLIKESRPSSYSIDVVGIKVGGKKLSISPSVFSYSGTIIDSGTDITRLQPEAYAALRTRFRKLMKNYKMTGTEAEQLFDTCYDFSGLDSDKIVFPAISFIFGGNVEVPIDKTGIMYKVNETLSCLAFARTGEDPVGIFGGVQQQTLNVVYDVDGGRLGFGIGGC